MSSQKFIVVLDKSATQAQMDKAAAEIESSGGRIVDTWTSALKGFSVEIHPDSIQSLNNLQGSNLINTIEPDGEVKTQ